MEFLVLLRFLLFIAVVYLALHSAASAWIKNPANKIHWFFSIVTGPLIYPVRRWLPRPEPEARLRRIALALYSGLWLLTVLASRLLAE